MQKQSVIVILLVAVMISIGVAIASLVDKPQASVAAGITYTTEYAVEGDAPIFGTMIGPSHYYVSDTGTGATAEAGGNALDQDRVFMYDWNPLTDFRMLKWNMGFATNFVRVYPDVEHDGDLNWDYLQWSLWGSNTGDENANAWTLLWDPISTSGYNVDTFEVKDWNATEPPTTITIYRYGSDLGQNAWDDAFTIDFNLATSYQYFGLRVSTLALNAGSPDPEVDAVASVEPAPTPTPTATPAPTHYGCYSIPPHLVEPWATVETQFGQDLAAYLDAESLCAPALKDGEGDLTAPHLKCYEMIPEGHDPPDVVNLTDQFGVEENVPVGRAIRFCQAVSKWTSGIPDHGPVTPPSLHYVCYSIPPELAFGMVTLETQFGQEFVGHLEAESLCAPALKNGEGDLTAPHLKCYKILLPWGVDPPDVVNLTDQFGTEWDVPIGPAQELCVEAEKVVLPGVGGTIELLVDSSDSPARASEGGGAPPPYAAIAGIAAACGLALAAGGWYARRRLS